MSKINFVDLIHCKNADEVREAVRKWSSDKTEQEQLIRSSILDMHVNVEISLKWILYQHMLTILFQDDDQKKYEKHRAILEKTISDMNFSAVHRILKPCLNAFPASELKLIGAVNDVRNSATHKSIDAVSYKGRNPFKDHDALAELFVDCWAIRKCLSDFYERKIEDPQALAKYYKEYYDKHQKTKANR